MAKNNPNNHIKPTKEQLEEGLEKDIEEAEKLKDETPEENPEEEEEAKAEANPEDETPEVVDTPEEEGDEAEEAPEEDEQAEPSKELYKKKFSESSRENQKINAKNRVINKAIQEAEDIPEPTEEEMQSLYGDDWDLMSDVDKKLVKETEITKRWRAKIKEASDQATKIEKWNDSVDEFIDDPTTLNDNPELDGKGDEFREFATKDENNNVPFNILVGAFLHEQTKNKKKNTGKMFERGKGGSNERPQLKNGKITLEEGRKLRETNYPKWKEMVSKDLIDDGL